ncbi:MAG: amidohydrolase family protein [Cyclobacteriaceae bacterium]|nr:amidohydrolase family protein [Cyclobacteriaceae bacterium]
MRTHHNFFALIILIALSSGSAAAQNRYAIKNVSVIPMNREVVLSNQTVLIEDGIIKNIGNSGKVKIGKDYKVIDGTGKYLMPGLFDMHTHFFYEHGKHVNTNETELKLMLANGITMARIMTGHPSYLEARENVKTGKWIGPELKVACPQLVGRWPWSPDFKNYEIVASAEKATKAVKEFKEQGYDAIKITFMMASEIFDAVVKAAAEENIKVVGHVGPIVKLPKALAAKQQIEHMDMFIEMLLPDTSYNHGQSVSDFNIYSKAAWATVPHLDESKIPALAKSVKDAGIYVTPTNYFFITNAGLPFTDEEIKQKPDYNYLPSDSKEEKWKYRNSYLKNMAPLESREKYVHIRKKMVYELWKAGVPLMAGSDAPEFFVVAGFSIHDELKTMVDAGLTPFAALQTATVNPATFMEMNTRTGTIEAGKEADFLLLDKNPLEDIQNTRAIHGVFTNSGWYDNDAVNNLLQQALVLGQ